MHNTIHGIGVDFPAHVMTQSRCHLSYDSQAQAPPTCNFRERVKTMGYAGWRMLLWLIPLDRVAVCPVREEIVFHEGSQQQAGSRCSKRVSWMKEPQVLLPLGGLIHRPGSGGSLQPPESSAHAWISLQDAFPQACMCTTAGASPWETRESVPIGKSQLLGARQGSGGIVSGTSEGGILGSRRQEGTDSPQAVGGA